MQGRFGREIRTWPLVLFLTLLMGVAIGCVLWFMNEAMRNERMALRQRMVDVYSGHVALAQKNVQTAWNSRLEQIANRDPGSVHFEWCVKRELADSVICLNGEGKVVSPRPALPAKHPAVPGGSDAVQAGLRAFFKSGERDAAVRFVLETFTGKDSAQLLDGDGRLVSANAELMALELLNDTADPQFVWIAGRLESRLLSYEATNEMPSAQRRFLMHALLRLTPERSFPTLAAEELAARYLETNPAFPSDSVLRSTELPGVYAVGSHGNRVHAVFKEQTLRSVFQRTLEEFPMAGGAAMTILAPGEDPVGDAMPVMVTMGERLPGWRIRLSLGDQSFFEAMAEKRAARYGVIASMVIGTMTLLSLFVARSFGRQMQLARLKNDLVATVSHELKTPLTAMRLLVDTLLDAGHLDETVTREYLKLLATENTRLNRLIENFLTFSRLERNKYPFQFTPFHPEAVVEGALEAFRERIHWPGLAFQSILEDSLPEVSGDADALTTALLNLLDNAFKYTGDDKRICLRTTACAGRVRFEVEDNGQGLSPGESRRVFEAFHQSDQRLSRSVGGCGLGLSIVRSIVEAHGGVVRVASTSGHGSIFTIELPALANAS